MLSDYARFHQDRLSLLIHLVFVPLFALSLVYAVYCLVQGRWVPGAIGLLLVLVSLAIQSVAHKREPVPPEPFLGPANFLGRILSEQYFRFWVFLLSGRFLAALRASGARR